MARKTFFYIDHQGKGKAYRDALLNAGWEQIHSEDQAMICLADSDVTPFRVKRLHRIADSGAKIFIYEHSGRPPFFYDFPGWAPHPRVTARFVSAIGHWSFMQAIGIERDVHIVGWSLCPRLPFVSPAVYEKVLFAPLHACENLWMSDQDRAMNHEVHRRLVELARIGRIKLKVRYLYSLESCGLQETPGVEYVPGFPNQDYSQIDESDVVVGTETFAYIAAARGKPTLMMDEVRAPRYGSNPEEFGYVSNWVKYAGLVMYPLDILSSPFTRQLIHDAVVGSEEVEMWKGRMIGASFDPWKFVSIIESYL